MSSARAFLKGIIDYAGLFPPARLRMDDAVREYARYRCSDERDLIGKFILPASRLNEFSAASHSFLGGDNHSVWALSAIATPGDDLEVDDVRRFNREHPPVQVEAIEMPVHSEDEVRWAAEKYLDSFSLFLEPTPGADSAALLTAIAKAGAAAKLRTGGVVAAAIPPAGSVIQFIDTCAALSLSFKATAGLHHAIRGDYPLTYEENSLCGTMYGYLNVFLTAAFHRAGLAEASLNELLEERDTTSIVFDESGARWRGHLADNEKLLDTRRTFAVSFGSCSFREPVDEAKALHLI